MNTLAEKVLQQLGSIVVILDEEGDAQYVSPSVKNVLGFEPHFLMGSGWLTHTRMNEAERVIVKSDLRKIAEGIQKNHSYERMLRTSSGGQKWIHWNTVSADDGKFIGIGYDITQQKQREDLLTQRTKDLQERNQEMESGLRYAQRIQSAILPQENELKRKFRDAFVYYKPKDIVSGDFWWLHETDDSVYVAVIDCTGHGIPGALMSVLAHSVFREVFINRNPGSTSRILELLDEELFIALNKEHPHNPYPDGMDVALCRFLKHSNTLEYSGAYRPLVLFRDGVMQEIAASRYPIGYYNNVPKKFETTTLQLRSDDVLFMFSDGYADQFGGEREKKLNKRGFRELLQTIHTMKGEEQSSFLDYALTNWKQQYAQTDDITVVGIRY